MGEVVNLRHARKAKARKDAATIAAENRAAFGRTRAEKLAIRTDELRRTRLLDGAKRDE